MLLSHMETLPYVEGTVISLTCKNTPPTIAGYLTISLFFFFFLGTVLPDFFQADLITTISATLEDKRPCMLNELSCGCMPYCHSSSQT